MKIRFLDLFSGCGGMTLGFNMSKHYEDVGFVENWHPAVETYKSNFKKSILIGEDITKITESDMNKLHNTLGPISVIIGGPPCQGFSIAGKRDPKDPRNSLFMDFVRFVKKFKPKMFLMENVRGLTSSKTSKGEKVLDLIINQFNEIGYEVDYRVINAADYGVPQFRHRIFLVGRQKGMKTFHFPEPTHAKEESVMLDGNKIKKHSTVRDTIGDLEPLESGEKSKNDPLHFSLKHAENHIRWMKETKEGQSAHDNKDPNLRPKSGFWTTYKRFFWDEPAPAVTTCFSSISSQNNVHPKDTRAMTIREAARLQTFPDSFKFENSVSSMRIQIGNAVPPLLAKILAESIKKYFDENIN